MNYTDENFKKAKYDDKLSLTCCVCGGIYFRTKRSIHGSLRDKRNQWGACSNACRKIDPKINLSTFCGTCNKSIIVKVNNKKSKSGFNFCSQSCSATYNNTHKTKGIRRSKLEIWLEEQLTTIYPTLEILYCQKDAINSELDIYIPCLKLAFECNGIFHYEPIYGLDKLNKTQNNDNRKFQACLERNIELVIMDTSKVKYSIPRNFKPFLDIIKSIIDLKLSNLI